jgi:hypothetical protein
VKRALLGLGLVLFAAGAHLGLLFFGVYRRYPFEWWAVALAGVLVARAGFSEPRAGPKVVAAAAILAAAVFGYVTTVGTRIHRPPLTIAAGQAVQPFTVDVAGEKPLSFPNSAEPHRATLLVLFRGVW